MKYTLRSFSHVVMLSVACLSLSAGAAAEFTLRFATSGDLDQFIFEPEIEFQAFELGFKADATAFLDDGEVPYPVGWSQGGIEFYMASPDPSVEGLSRDFRPLSDSQVWVLKLDNMEPGHSVTLDWRLESGSLDGNPLQLRDRATGTVLVADMTATTTVTLTDEDQELLVLYGDPNHPPVAMGEEFFMLRSDGSIAIPIADLLPNDFDPDPGQTISFVEVGLPQLAPDGTKGGTTPYGTTTYDAVTEQIVYEVPPSLPADWDGIVAFDYTITDDFPLEPLQASATILVNVAPTVVLEPLPTALYVQANNTVTLTYMLRYEGTLHSLALDFTLPMIGTMRAPVYWLYADNYADNAAETPDPTIDDGAGDDGVLGTADDNGWVILDFGTDVPPSGTLIAFDLTVPADPTDKQVASAARYRVTGTEEDPLNQILQPLDLRVLQPITFVAGDGGSIAGDTPQYVEPGTDSTDVTAVPGAGYAFSRWTMDGETFSTDNPIAVTATGQAMTLTAEFESVLLGGERNVLSCVDPGTTIDVDVLVTKFGTEALTSFSIHETLPPGWQYAGLTSTPAPAVSPNTGATGTISFEWSTVPDFPMTLVYQVNVPAGDADPVSFDGSLLYQTTGGDVPVPITGDTVVDVGDCCSPHDADQNGNWTIEVAPEITRIIQFYNSGGYHCQEGTEDGYAPGAGDQTCEPHDADQNGNWTIEVSPEITRIIQFYNSGGYQCQEGTEDGYAPGAKPDKSLDSTLVKQSETVEANPDTTAAATADRIRLRTSARLLADSVVAKGEHRLEANWMVGQPDETPEGIVEITVVIDHADPAALTSLVLEQTLPDSWSFAGMVSVPEPYLIPETGREGGLLFGWVDMPQEWPVILTYRVNLPEDGTGLPAVLSGSVTFRENDEALRSLIPDMTVAP